LLVTLGALGSATGIIVRRRLSHLDAVAKPLAAMIIFTVALLAAHIVPGALAILYRGTVPAVAILILAGSLFVRRQSDEAGEKRGAPGGAFRDRGDTALSLALTAIAGIGALVYVLAAARHQFGMAPTQIDELTFHLPNGAKWIQTHTMWRVDNFVATIALGNYPQNGDVVQAAFTLPWHDDFASHLTTIPYLLFAGLGVYALGRELGAPSSASIVFASAVLTIPVIAQTALLNGQPDAVLLASFAAALLFLARHWRTGRHSDLVLAGLGLGIAFGTKWYGVSSVPAVVAVWLAVSLVARRQARMVARQAAVLIGLVLLAGGFWLLRNWVVSGNPVMPLKIAPFGVTIFDAPPDQFRAKVGFTVMHYIARPHIWTEWLLPSYRHPLGIPAIVIGVTLLAGLGVAVVAGRRKGWASVGKVLAALLCTFVLVLVFLNTPYSAAGLEGRPGLAGVQTRYLGPAFLLAAALGAWTCGRLPRAGILLEGCAIIAMFDGMRLGIVPDVSDFAEVIVIALLVVAGALAVRKAAARRRRVRNVLAMTALVMLLTSFVMAEYVAEKRVMLGRWRGFDPTVDWVLDHAATGHEVGITGAWNNGGISPVRPAFGDRLENDVEFVGPTVRGMLRHYAHRGSFIRALRSRDYDLLLIGRGGTKPKPHVKEEVWAHAAGYALVVQSDRGALYRKLSKRARR
jgi:hypothetical protein